MPTIFGLDMAISPLIIVRFEKFKNWHEARNKPVLYGGLCPRSAGRQALKPAKDGRTGSILRTARNNQILRRETILIQLLRLLFSGACAYLG